MTDYLTPEDVAQKLGITRVEVLRQVRLGRLACLRLNRVTYRFTQQHMDAYLAAAEQRAAVPAPREPIPGPVPPVPKMGRAARRLSR